MTHRAVIVEQELERTREPKALNVGKVERWASLIAGGLVAYRGIRKLSGSGIAMALTGGYLLYRGATGHCGVYESLGVSTAVPETRGLEIEDTITVNRPVEEVYGFWRNIENLPRFMEHLESVQDMGGGRSRWIALTPGGLRVAWDSEITEERPNELIRWRSLPGSDIRNEGIVMFRRAPGGRGTELRVKISYMPPAGAAGAAAVSLLKSLTAMEIKEEIRRLKQVIETGEAATIEGQVSGAVA